MQRHREALPIFSEMNLTNMLDTAFILLLAFLLVAPMIKHGIDLELPTVTPASPINAENQTLTIAIGKSLGPGLTDRVYIEDKRVTLDEMEQIIDERRQMYPKLDILIESDKAAVVETLLQVVGRLREMGMRDIGLPTNTADVRPEAIPESTPDSTPALP